MSNETTVDTATYLTFTLAEEQYAVDVTRVKEVLEYTRITRVPRTRDFMRGVINLRGSVVPVVDLRTKFGLETADATIATSIIVTEITIEGDTVVVGTLADSVQEVVNIASHQIETTPRLGTRIDADFIDGIANLDDRFLIVLNIDRIFSDPEMVGVAEHAEA